MIDTILGNSPNDVTYVRTSSGVAHCGADIQGSVGPFSRPIYRLKRDGGSRGSVRKCTGTSSRDYIRDVAVQGVDTLNSAIASIDRAVKKVQGVMAGEG